DRPADRGVVGEGGRVRHRRRPLPRPCAGRPAPTNRAPDRAWPAVPGGRGVPADPADPGRGRGRRVPAPPVHPTDPVHLAVAGGWPGAGPWGARGRVPGLPFRPPGRAPPHPGDRVRKGRADVRPVGGEGVPGAWRAARRGLLQGAGFRPAPDTDRGPPPELVRAIWRALRLPRPRECDPEPTGIETSARCGVTHNPSPGSCPWASWYQP